MSRSVVVVAGATGYLGRYVVQALKARGLRVRVLVRDSARLAESGTARAPAVSDVVDEVVVGDLTNPASIRGLCTGADAVFSSVSLMGKREGRSWRDVDYAGNMALLREAQLAGVGHFVYVSVFNADRLADIPIVAAHEAFARDLAAAPVASTVIRPTGYFSDLGVFVEMARSGRVYLIGNGSTRINPIHGEDLAEVCVDAIGEGPAEIDVGGPQVLTQREIAQLASNAVTAAAAANDQEREARRLRIIPIPLPLARAGVAGARVLAPRRGELWRFFVESASMDHIAPARGSQRLADHFAQVAAGA